MKEGNLFPFFRSCSFYIKNKLKSETFKTKMLMNKNVFLLKIKI